MTNYEVFKNASPEVMAQMLASLTVGALGGPKYVSVEQCKAIYKELLEFLQADATTVTKT